MHRKVNRYTKAIILASFIISAGLVVFIALNSNLHISDMSENNSRLYSAYRISELLKSFEVKLNTLEDKKTAYLGTGDPKFLEELTKVESETKNDLKEMEKYFSGKPEEKLFYTLKDLSYTQIMESRMLNPRNRPAGFEGKDTKAGAIKSLAQINKIISTIDKSLSTTTAMLLKNSTEFVRVTQRWNILEVSFGVIVSLAALFLLLRDLSIRNRLENELRIAKKLADDNAAIKDQFMANMSHEIRTPMNAILGFTGLLLKNNRDENQREYVQAIHTSSSNLLNIINDILDFSKIEAGKMTIEKVSFRLSDLIDSLRVMFQEKAKEKNIHFSVQADQSLPDFLFGDPTRLTQILVNLINNAIKFTEEGEVKLQCELKNLEHNVAQIVFRVSDTGIGIPSDKIEQVFDRFNQGSAETTRKYGGTGLGLSIVKNLVELQNGDIKVKSRQHFGSQFIVTLSYPLSFPVQSNEGLPVPSGLKFDSEKKYRILVAEDNKLNQKLAIAYLQDFGLQVDLADNGRSALEKLSKKSYDLLLLDIQMPLLDGYTTAQMIRQELRLDLPIVAMTAHVMEGEKEKCLRMGMNDYISKPFKEDELFRMVAKFLVGQDETDPDSKTDGSNTDTESNRGLVNFDDIENMGRGRREFIREMIELFLEQNPRDLMELETALRKSDYPSIASVSHRLKTPMGFMGLKHLAEELNAMETLAASTGDLDQINRLFDKVKATCLLATAEYKEALNTRYQ